MRSTNGGEGTAPGATSNLIRPVTLYVPDPIIAPPVDCVAQVTPPVTSPSSPGVKVPLPVSVIIEPSCASAEAVPPAAKVRGWTLVNWMMSHRTVPPSPLALDAVNSGNRIMLARKYRFLMSAPSIETGRNGTITRPQRATLDYAFVVSW